MKNDLHIFTSNDPLKEGLDYITLCGKEVEKARFKFVWDQVEKGPISMQQLDELSFKGVCAKCRMQPKDRKFIYGLVAGKIAEKYEHAEMDQVD